MCSHLALSVCLCLPASHAPPVRFVPPPERPSVSLTHTVCVTHTFIDPLTHQESPPLQPNATCCPQINRLKTADASSRLLCLRRRLRLQIQYKPLLLHVSGWDMDASHL